MLKRVVGRLLNILAFISPFGKTLRPFLQKLRGVKIGKNVWISLYVFLDELHPESISIGDNSTIGLRTSIITHTYFGPPQKNNTGKVTIGNNVFIGPHCLILPNVRIGDNSVIKGGTVISKDVPSNTMVGYPHPSPIAHVTIPLTPEHSYSEFLTGLKPIRGNKENVNL